MTGVQTCALPISINKYQMTNEVSYVSTGGGALLEFIEQGTLPGVKAILE